MTPKDCSVAAIIKNGKILRGLRHYTPDKYKEITVWTIPGGRCDEGESLEQTLRREVAEEVGINQMRIIQKIGTSKGAKEGDVLHIFWCETDDEPTLMEPEKFSRWAWFDIAHKPSDFPDINDEAFEIIKNFFNDRKL